MPAKLQHYVPQFYLRNFATKARNGHLICCFDKFTRKTFKSNVKNVASQTKFYDFTDSSGDEVSLEESFSDIETEAGMAIQALIGNPRMSTLLPHKKTLARFFAIQDSRTQVFRDTQNEFVSGVNRKFRNRGFSLPIPTEDEEKEFQARFLIDTSTGFASTLLDMKWILVANHTPKPFWTSDNPIFKYNPIKDDLRGNIGLMCDGIQVHIPISPHLVIVICDPIGYAHHNDVATADLQNVEFNNSGQVLNSRQHIFLADNDFGLAQKMIDKDPGISNPNRPRIVIDE